MYDSMLNDAETRMRQALDALEEDLDGFRTGRASTALVDRITVDYYDTQTPINQLSTVSTPEPRLITIRPWDKNSMPAIERAIMASDLGLTPSNDGQVIRLPIPPLTQERRTELVRLVSQRIEEARVTIRNIRRDVIQDIEKADLPEDDEYTAKERAQELTDKYIAKAESLGEQKSTEIREV